MSEKKELKSARELVRSPHLTRSQANAILKEVERSVSPDLPVWRSLPSMIRTGFDWSRTPQGQDYWKALYSHVIRRITQK